MRHRKNKVTLDRTSAGRRGLTKSLMNSLVLRGKITTTLAKAKAIRPQIERIVTHAKQDTLSNRRYIIQRLSNEQSLGILMKKIGPAQANRPGGYTRITKIPNRVGDNSPQAMIEFV